MQILKIKIKTLIYKFCKYDNNIIYMQIQNNYICERYKYNKYVVFILLFIINSDNKKFNIFFIYTYIPT